jgi:hypothetical protein
MGALPCSGRRCSAAQRRPACSRGPAAGCCSHTCTGRGDRGAMGAGGRVKPRAWQEARLPGKLAWKRVGPIPKPSRDAPPPLRPPAPAPHPTSSGPTRPTHPTPPHPEPPTPAPPRRAPLRPPPALPRFARRCGPGDARLRRPDEGGWRGNTAAARGARRRRRGPEGASARGHTYMRRVRPRSSDWMGGRAGRNAATPHTTTKR